MYVLRLWWELKVDKLHVLAPAEAEIFHESLQKSFGGGVPISQRPRNDRGKYIGLFDTPGNTKELEQRVKILDVVDAECC